MILLACGRHQPTPYSACPCLPADWPPACACPGRHRHRRRGLLLTEWTFEVAATTEVIARIRRPTRTRHASWRLGLTIATPGPRPSSLAANLKPAA